MSDRADFSFEPYFFLISTRKNTTHYRQGLDGRRQKSLAFLTSESGSPKKWFAIEHENHRNWGYAHFRARLTLNTHRTGREVQTAA